MGMTPEEAAEVILQLPVGERAKASRFAILYGSYFVHDGKVLDPTTVEIETDSDGNALPPMAGLLRFRMTPPKPIYGEPPYGDTTPTDQDG